MFQSSAITGERSAVSDTKSHINQLYSKCQSSPRVSHPQHCGNLFTNQKRHSGATALFFSWDWQQGFFFLDHSAPALILSMAKTSEEKSPSLRFGRKLVSFIFREHNWVWKSVTHKQHVPLKGQKQSPLFFHYLLIHEKLSVENYI